MPPIPSLTIPFFTSGYMARSARMMSAISAVLRSRSSMLPRLIFIDITLAPLERMLAKVLLASAWP